MPDKFANFLGDCVKCVKLVEIPLYPLTFTRIHFKPLDRVELRGWFSGWRRCFTCQFELGLRLVLLKMGNLNCGGELSCRLVL